MQLRLECPICESQFQIERESSPVMSICPECNRQFRTSTAIVISNERPKREKLILPEQIVSSSVLPTRESPQTVEPADVSPEPTQPAAPISPTVPVEPIKRMYAKKPNKSLPLTVIGALGIIAVALLIYLPFVINRNAGPNEQPDVTLPTPQPEGLSEESGGQRIEDSRRPAVSNLDAAQRILAGFGDQEPQLGSVEPQQKKWTPKPAPERRPEFFTDIQLEDCWRQHHARIVRLKIANAMGEHLALGTLVDSRGWIVTSYRAVAGATQIRVTQSASSFEQFKQGTPLSDFVRGVLAVDVENDLAVLAINRRFVLNFSDLNVAEEDVVIGTDHLAQFGLIDEETPLIVRETQVTARPRFAELDSDAMKHFKNNGLDSDSRRWILHSNQDGTIAGAPLITIEGQLAGMCTDQPESKTAYAIPVPTLRALLKSIEADAQTDGGKKPLGLATLSNRLEEIGKTNLSPTSSVNVDNPNREISIRFNRIGEKCSRINWMPKNVDEYRLLQEFSKQLIEINDTISEISDDPDDVNAQQNLENRTTLLDQTKRWTDELKAALAPRPISNEHVAEFNDTATRALRSETFVNGQPAFFLAYIRVRLGAMDSPKPNAGQDTLTLDIEQTEEILNVLYDERFPPMRPDTLWLAIYTIGDPGKINFTEPNSNKKLAAHTGIIMMVLGPLR